MKSGKTVHVTGQCPAGAYPQFLVPGASFGAKVDDRPSDRVRQGVILSGRSHKAVFHLVVGKDTSIPASQFACASYKLAAQAASEMEPVEVALSGKTMTLQATSTDPVLIATAFSPQWQCSNATTDGSTGFFTVRPQKEGEVSCTFKTVGLMPGVAVSAVTLLAIAVGAFLWRRKQGAKK